MKTEKQNLCENYFVLGLHNRIAVLWSCCLWCFVEPEFFFWTFLKGIVHQLLKWGALKCNHVAIRNSLCLQFFFLLSNQVVKMRKVFPSDASYVSYELFSAGFFYWGFLFACKGYPVFHWGNFVWKILSKVGRWEKR